MSYLIIENEEHKRSADELVCMMSNPQLFTQETLTNKLEPCIKKRIDKFGAYKPERRCCNSSDFCEVFNAGVMGRGVRAKRTIWANTHIGCYTGVLRSAKDAYRGNWKYNYQYGLRGYHIDATPNRVEWSMMAIVNHSEKEENVSVEYMLHEMPDGSVECHIVYVAKRAIMRMEELFIDYGPDYWNYAKKCGIVKYDLDQRGHKQIVAENDPHTDISEINRRISVLRVDEYGDDNEDSEEEDIWPYQRLSPFYIETGQKLITDYMIR